MSLAANSLIKVSEAPRNGRLYNQSLIHQRLPFGLALYQNVFLIFFY